MLGEDEPLFLDSGFGWKFGIGSHQGFIYPFFHPHHLAGAMGTLTVSVSRGHRGATESCSYSLPCSSPTAIHTFPGFCTSTVAKDPYIHFTVTCPSDLLLPTPNPILTPETSKGIKQVLRACLVGECFDTKFCLFSGRTPSGRVSRPLALYASSSVLKGQSSYIDTCQSFTDAGSLWKLT